MSEEEITLTRFYNEFKGHVKENITAHNRIYVELAEHGKEEKEVRKLIFGNGEVGVLERLRDLEEIASAGKKIAMALVISVVIASGSFLAGMVIWYIEQR